MKPILYPLALAAALCSFSCDRQTLDEKQSEIETGKLLNSGTYTAEVIGWTAAIPRSWEVMSREAKERMTDAGARVVEEATGEPVITTGLQQLVNLRKDAQNNFMSSIEPYDVARNGPWSENLKNVVSVMKDGFRQAGTRLGGVTEGTETVDRLEFATAQFEILNAAGEVEKIQKLYARAINGYAFSMILTSNNDADRATLQQIVDSSTFTKRN